MGRDGVRERRKTVMFLRAMGRARWPAYAVLLLGCAAGSRNANEPMAADVDRVGLTDRGKPMRDEAAITGPVLERSKFVRAVLDRNRSIESARQAWRAAGARVRESGTFDDPMATVDVAPLSIGSRNARFGWDATISQRLPWPGKVGLDQAAAQAEADAARSDFESARRELALTASLLFDQYFVSARSIEINAHHVDLMRGMRAAAAAQYESGRGSAQDPLQAEFELTHMEHDAVILASQEDITVAQMNELLHRAPDLPLPPPPHELTEPPASDGSDVRASETYAVAHRPDIAAALDHARAAQAHVDRANREYFPDVTLATTYSTMWDMPEHRWTVGLSFNLPVQTGRRGGAADEASATRARYEADAARMTDAARTQVAVALKELEESRHVLHLFEERLVPVAHQEVDAARAAFISSQAPFVALIDAEKNLRGVELDQEVGRAECDRRRAELDRALGRIPGLDESGVAP